MIQKEAPSDDFMALNKLQRSLQQQKMKAKKKIPSITTFFSAACSKI
jgi:hypothetical protein